MGGVSDADDPRNPNRRRRRLPQVESGWKTAIADHGMPQIFHPSMNTISRATIFGAVFIIAFVGWIMGAVVRSPYATSAGVIKEQPVPFSHEHHVAECGIDCRYCHTSVEDSSFAGIPPTQTCMNCHRELWTESRMLEPVRASYRTGAAVGVEPCARSARLCLLRSQHSRSQRRKLHDMSRASRPDAAHAPGSNAAYGVVS